MHDAVGLFQISTVKHGSASSENVESPSSHGENSGIAPIPRTCSFTDEFVQAVRRFSEAQDHDPLPMHALEEESTLPPALRELWELRRTEALQDGDDPATQFRVETWFLDHVNFDRCYHSRIVTLTSEPSTWLSVLLQHWSDRSELGARVDIALVYPASEDQAPGTSAQLILTQFPQEALRSIILSVYDTGRSQPTPRTFGLVHGASISLRSVLEEVRLINDCPPHVQHNECVLWFGSTVIPEQRQVFVRTGNAFRLCIRRGQRINLQDLLALPDALLRRQLQDAIHGEIYRRPPGPGFPSDVMDANTLPEVPSAMQPSSASDQPPRGSRPPQWIEALNQFFAHHSATEMLEEGPVLYIQSWYVNGCSHMWCTEPRAVRLTSDFTMWRTAIAQAWHDRIQGSLPAEFWVVQPIPPFSPSQGFTVHVILSQSMQPDQTAVLLTATQDHTPDVVCQHAAYVLPRRSLGEDIARFAVPPWFRSSVMTVLFAGRVYPFDAFVSLYSGANVVVRYGEFDRPEPSGPSDGTMMLQLNSKVRSVSGTSSLMTTLVPRPISLEQELLDTEEDIANIPLSLGQFLSSSAIAWTVCAWELPHGNTDTVLLGPDESIGPSVSTTFRSKHDFLKPVSSLFPVRFLRTSWCIHAQQLWIGSFQVPSQTCAIVLCVRYQADGAVYGVRTFPQDTTALNLRQSLSVQHSTKIRRNGQLLSSEVHLRHGDVVEYHAAPSHVSFDLNRQHPKVQLCLEASIPTPSCSFDEDRDATLLLQCPDTLQMLQAANEWHFVFLPAGLDMHPATYEALHLQPVDATLKPDILELYVDGATPADTSAWAVVAVALSPAGRTFYGCVSGITQLCPEHPHWVGATQHGKY